MLEVCLFHCLFCPLSFPVRHIGPNICHICPPIPNFSGHPGQKFLESTANPSGRFQFWGLTPGDYKLFAWQSLETLPYLDEAFLRSIEDQGKSVRVEKNSQQQVTLRPIDEESTK